jgi:hypothetical protein
MRISFCGQTPKDPNYPEACEDAVEIAQSEGRLAISDGASESFDSKTWAKMLVKAFVRSPGLSPGWISKVTGDYKAIHDISALSWSKLAAFERGSFATLLGLEVFPPQSTVDVLSVGDSLAVLLSDSEMHDSFPYCDPQQFQDRPELFCTNPSLNGFFERPDFFNRHFKTLKFEGLKKPALLCMTDALGEWALKMAREGEPQWGTLLSISDESQLQCMVTEQRQLKRMRVDDVTLVTIALDGVVLHELPDV